MRLGEVQYEIVADGLEEGIGFEIGIEYHFLIVLRRRLILSVFFSACRCWKPWFDSETFGISFPEYRIWRRRGVVGLVIWWGFPGRSDWLGVNNIFDETWGELYVFL